jgi:nucleoside-diphosphate-sugar epimerase
VTTVVPFPTAPHLPVGVIGGTSLVGRFLIPRLLSRGHVVVACSRTAPLSPVASVSGPAWVRPGAPLPGGIGRVPVWIALAPIWATVDLLDWLESVGVEQLVALSSTSLVTKHGSSDPAERRLAAQLAFAEEAVHAWADRRGVSTTVLRPTMIYDGVNDGNVSAIAAWVQRWGWLPLCGPAHGLRQPVHADDVAAASVTAAFHPDPRRLYPLSGGEKLTFRQLVERTCRSHGLTPRTVQLPAWAWRLLIGSAHRLGLARNVSAAMGTRMNQDLVFDHADAMADLGFRPRHFVPAAGNGATGVPPKPPASGRESLLP